MLLFEVLMLGSTTEPKVQAASEQNLHGVLSRVSFVKNRDANFVSVALG
jgi:hypothetical protein